MAGVTAASPTVVGAAFAVRADAKEAVFVQGVDPERFLAIMDVRQKIVAGRFDLTSGQVAIGSTLARELNVGVADKIRITTTEGIEDIVTVSGIFTFGNEGVDKTWLITSLRHAQSIYALPGGATTLQIKVDDVFDARPGPGVGDGGLADLDHGGLRIAHVGPPGDVLGIGGFGDVIWHDGAACGAGGLGYGGHDELFVGRQLQKRH